MIKKIFILILIFVLGIVMFIPSVFAFNQEDKAIINNIIKEQQNINNKINDLNVVVKSSNESMKKEQENLDKKIDDEIKYLQREVNNLNGLVTEKERNLLGQMLQFSEKSMQYAKHTVNGFLCFLALLTGLLALFGWKTIKDIKKSANENVEFMVKNIVNKKIKEIDERFDDINLKIKKDKKISALWNTAIEEKDKKRKLEIYDKILKKDDDNYQVILSKSRIYTKLGEHEEAIRTLKKAKIIADNNEEDVDELEYAVSLSFSYHNNGDFENAYEVASESLSKDPSCLELIVNKGLAAAGLGKHEEAIELLNKARQDAPGNSEVIYCQARAFSLLKDSENALAVLKKAVNIDSKWIKQARKEKDFKYIAELDEFKRMQKLLHSEK